MFARSDLKPRGVIGPVSEIEQDLLSQLGNGVRTGRRYFMVQMGLCCVLQLVLKVLLVELNARFRYALDPLEEEILPYLHKVIKLFLEVLREAL
jgi:hypothetical protein